MLAELRIEDLAVVKEARAELGPGLNVITGETGAGKTILLEAVQLAVGGRASIDLVRADADEACIEARFELSGAPLRRVARLLEEMGLPEGGDQLIVRRRISREGKSRAYINDANATVGALARITTDLVELTGQHEQLGLLRPRRHRELLDAFARSGDRLTDMAATYVALRAAEARSDELRAALANRAERMEFLRFYLREFDQVQPVPGEDEQLLEQAQRLRHAERLREGLATARRLVYDGQSNAYDLLSEARGKLANLISADKRLEPVVSQIDVLQSELDELSRTLTRYRDQADAEPAQLEQLEERLHGIQRLCRKHGGTLTDVIETMEAARSELEGLAELDLRFDEAEADRARATETALKAARALTAWRTQAIEPLVEATTAHLRDLGFLQTRFRVKIETDASPEGLTELGADRVTFEASTNPGQPLRPLAKVASGGELSRLLLGLKCALAGTYSVPVQVLDEIDAGLGGAAGEIVGRKIRQLADGAQVLCVTHLPQIASFADRHLEVTKRIDGAVTVARLRSLSGVDREEELARMLGGTEITETTREHAREMLGRAWAS